MSRYDVIGIVFQSVMSMVTYCLLGYSVIFLIKVRNQDDELVRARLEAIVSLLRQFIYPCTDHCNKLTITFIRDLSIHVYFHNNYPLFMAIMATQVL